jgi:hypothetical protein
LIYNDQFTHDPVNFCRPTANGGLGKTLVVEDRGLFMKLMNKQGLRQKPGRNYFSVQKQGGHRVSFCQIIDNHKVVQNGQDVLLAENSGDCAARIIVDLPTAFDFRRWFQCFYLPWESQQTIRISLREPTGKVNFFFTSTVDGCSVIVEGSPAEPTVYHLNDSGGGGNPPDIGAAQGAQDAYWAPKQATMEGRFQAARSPKSIRTPDPNLPAAVGARGIHARGYMDLTAGQAGALDTVPLYLARLADAQRLYPGATSWKFIGTSYKPYGTVFGWRQNGTWTFYYQRRAIMIYRYNGQFPTDNVPTIGTNILIVKQLSWHLDEFWPNGTGIAVAKGLVP